MEIYTLFPGITPWQRDALLGNDDKAGADGSRRPRQSGPRFVVASNKRWRCSVPVGGQSVAEAILERAQPGFVIPPLVDAFAADGLSHLLRTDRVHVTLSLMELQAGRLEAQATEVQDAAHIALQVLHHVFVLHGQDPPRQRLAPVPHELKIIAVLVRNVPDAVTELLAAREQLLEVAEAAGHGFAPSVDDFRIRQHQVDEADVA